MKLQRCQFEDATDGFDFRIDTSGACGPGVYAMKYGDSPMRKYYSKRGEKTFSFDVPDNLVKKIGGRGVTTYWAIRESIFMWQEKGFKVFICKHKGINIPTSKQFVITDQSIITNVKLES
jgi:hypothetical protein